MNVLDQIAVQLVRVRCYKDDCGLIFAVDRDWNNDKIQTRATFYCPNGHGQHYTGMSDVEKLQAELEAARSIAQREARRRTQAERNQQATEYRRRAAVGANTKLKKRIGNGVCPCCNRTFANVARHMSGQHPEFVAGESRG